MQTWLLLVVQVLAGSFTSSKGSFILSSCTGLITYLGSYHSNFSFRSSCY